MKCLLIAVVALLGCACTNGTQPYNNTRTEADLLILQTQVQQLQTRFDSLLQVPQPKTASSSKKTKAKAKAVTQAVALYSTGKASEYNWQPDDSKATPTVKPKREEALTAFAQALSAVTVPAATLRAGGPALTTAA